MLDFFRHLRPIDRFLLTPAFALFPIYLAWLLHGSIVTAHGPGAYGVTLVLALAAALLGVLVVHRYADVFPATIHIGVMCLIFVELLFMVASWDRLAIALTAFNHAAVLTLAVVIYLEKKWEAERAAEREVSLETLESNGGVTFSMQRCGDSACYCRTSNREGAGKGKDFALLA
jgi:hypothetical protein